MSADDSYPEAWKHPAIRRREAEERRQAGERKQFVDHIGASVTRVSGAGGHLGAVGLAAPKDAYPSEWRPRLDNEENDR